MLKRIAIAALLVAACASPGFAQKARQSQNGSVAIATGNTYQTVLAASQFRNSLTIQNNNYTTGDNCWIEVTGLVANGNTTATTVTPPGGSATTAVKASILLPAGASYQRYYPYIPSAAIVGTCTGSGDSLYVDTQ